MSIARAFDSQVLIDLKGSLHSFTLPPVLFNMYIGVIQEVGRGYTVDFARGDLHSRLCDWWAEEYPHIHIEKFNVALEKAVERKLGY